MNQFVRDSPGLGHCPGQVRCGGQARNLVTNDTVGFVVMMLHLAPLLRVDYGEICIRTKNEKSEEMKQG